MTRDHIDFGRPTPWTLSTLVNEPRLRLAELISVTGDSAYLKDSVTRKRFDAQAWGVIHYMLFGSGTSQVDRVNEVARRLMAGETSPQALTQVYGSVEALEQAYLEYHRRPITQFARLKTDGRISRSFPVRTLTTTEATMIRAGIHTVYGRTADAKALVAEARKTERLSPATYVTEGLLFDAAKNSREAAAAYSKAVELKSQNFFAFYRVAASLAEQRDSAVIPDAKSHAARAVDLNPFHSPSHSLLAQILAQGPTPADGLGAGSESRCARPDRSGCETGTCDGIRATVAAQRGAWPGTRRAVARSHTRTAQCGTRGSSTPCSPRAAPRLHRPPGRAEHSRKQNRSALRHVRTTKPPCSPGSRYDIGQQCVIDSSCGVDAQSLPSRQRLPQLPSARRMSRLNRSAVR